jgi:mobilization protein NikA
MARPQKPPDDRASAAFRIRLTAAARELLDEKAAAAGVTLSALIREAVLSYHLQPAPLWHEAINELTRIGINLNQIARHADATGALRADLGETLAEVSQAISRMLSLSERTLRTALYPR